jgi:hypothetical protein
MKRNRKAFVISFIKYLKANERIINKLSHISSFKNDFKNWENSFTLNINRKPFLLIIDPDKYLNENASHVNLRDTYRIQGRQSVIQLTIDNSNFIIEDDHFSLFAKRGITIGTKRSGLTQEYERILFERGFNKNKKVFEGSFNTPNYKSIAMDFFNWLVIASGAKIFLEGRYRSEPGGENPEEEEGNKYIVEHINFEKAIRNSNIVKLAKEVAFNNNDGRIKCECCSFDFKATYGVHGIGFIECHHTNPISNGKRITKIEDLALVCSNCHRMLHRQKSDGSYYDIDGLRKDSNLLEKCN